MTTTTSKKKGSTDTAAPTPLSKGEKYRGITLHDGKPAHLIELPGELASGTHAEALEWAKKQGGELPSRIDGIVLFDGKCGWSSAWYWLEPQRAGDAGYAWYQLFGDGDQYWLYVSSRCRARAVRRVTIS